MASFLQGLSAGIIVKFASLTYVLSVTVLFVCVISCWCSLNTISYTTKLITHLSLSSCYFLFLSNITASTLLSDTFTFHRKCSFHGDCMLWRRMDRWAALLWNPYSTFHPRLTFIYSFSSLSYDRSKASSKASSPHSAIQSFLLQMRISSPFLKVIH
jgi:hypothetical protein